MKITEPLFAPRATGHLFGVGFFAGPEGNTQFREFARAPRSRTRGDAAAHVALRAALVRFRTRPYAPAIRWHDFSPLQIRRTPALSLVFRATRQATHSVAATATLPQHLIEPH